MTQPNTLMGLLSDLSWPLEALVALQSDTLNIRASLVDLTNQLNRIEGKLTAMGQAEQAAAAQLETDITTIANGWAALQAANTALQGQVKALQDQLAAAGLAQTAAVQAQADADDTQAAADITAADTAINNILNPPAPPAPPAA